MKPAMLRPIGRKTLPLLILVGVSACNSADTPTDVIFSCDEYTVHTDSVVSKSGTAIAISPVEIAVSRQDGIVKADSAYTLKAHTVGDLLPQFSSDHQLVDALYNIAMSDISASMHADSRNGVRYDPSTCEAAYSTLISMAYIAPDYAMEVLRKKLSRDHTIQDDSFMAWPAVADRVIWVSAAYEIYKATGDRRWLEEVYSITKSILAEDLLILWDPHFKLMHGGVSYPEPTGRVYPDWMHTADIYETMCLTTNAIYAHTFDIAGEMAEILGDDGSEYKERAKTIATALDNHLWIPNLGYYSEYLYGGIFPIQSHATDNLGQSLAILYNIANGEMSESIMSKTPVLPTGVPPVFPMKYGTDPAQAEQTTPTVQALWNIAAAKSGNMKALETGLGALYRYAAFSDGSRTDWSYGVAAMVMRIYAGMSFACDGIRFTPCIPPVLAGEKRISRFRYRHAVLDISIEGTGSDISRFTVDGADQTDAFISADMHGSHSVRIVMGGNRPAASYINIQSLITMPQTPTTVWTDSHNVTITDFAPGLSYNVYLNGMFENQIQTGKYSLYNATEYTTVAFVPVSDEVTEGFTMRPHEYIPNNALTVIEAEQIAKGGTHLIKNKKVASQFVESSPTRNARMAFDLNITDEGFYMIDICYANGNGAGNSSIRILTVNGKTEGALIMPETGFAPLTATAMSNMLCVPLTKGSNHIVIDYYPAVTHQGGSNAPILIDYIRIIKQ